MRELDRFGAAAVEPLMAAIERNTDVWFDSAPPIFWLVERYPLEARGFFLRQLGRGGRRSLCIRGLLRAGAVADATPLLRDESPSVRLGAAYALACAPEVPATEALHEALRDERVGEVALAMRLALLRRGSRAGMTEEAFRLEGADTPEHPAWTRGKWLREGALREVADSFEAADDARLDEALARRSSNDIAAGNPWHWRSGEPLSPAAAVGLESLLTLDVPYGGDLASPTLLLACVRRRLDPASAEPLFDRVPRIAVVNWVTEAWLDAEGARLEKGGSKVVYKRLWTLSSSDRPEAIQWLAHGLRRLSFHGYRLSLWGSVGPLADVAPAIERLEVIPDYDFSPSGERTCHYGSMVVTLRLGPSGEIGCVDASGKIRKSVPKPKGAAPQDIARAEAEVKGIRRRVEHSFMLASEAFESAMIASRRWEPAAFRARFVEHPIGSALGASLVFLMDDGSSFQLAGRAARDLLGNQIAIDAPARIAHPIDLSPEEIQAWRALLPSQPFPQLAREIHPASLPEIVPGPYDIARLRERLRASYYISGRDHPYVYHCRDIAPYYTIVLEHAPLGWNQLHGTLDVLAVRVRRDEFDVPPGAIPRSLLSEIRSDLERLGIQVR